MIKVFHYIPEIDALIVDPKFKKISDDLGLSEWNEVVWIGRFFTLDNDYGEHWFDNWDERATKAEALGIPYEQILAINPTRFIDKRDGPCHTDEQRKKFWTDVLASLQLSWDLIFTEARSQNERRKQTGSEDYIPDLDERIKKMKDSF